MGELSLRPLTVEDQAQARAAHEELAAGAVTGSLEWSTLHWSVPDPVPVGGEAFEAAADELERRIHRLRPVKDPA